MDKLPKDKPVAIVTCSYEGQPADNAAGFVKWISDLGANSSALTGVNYAVFGCGNKEWAQTYQRIPKLVDETLAKCGATQIAEFGSVDVSGPNDPFTVFDSWMDDKLWPKLGTTAGVDAMAGILDIDIDTNMRPKHLRQDIFDGIVISNELMTKNTDKQKRHLQIRLPSGMEYKAGDYLVVLPLNHMDTVRRVLTSSSCRGMRPSRCTRAPPPTCLTATPSACGDALAAYFELSQPATKKTAAKIASLVHDAAQKDKAETGPARSSTRPSRRSAARRSTCSRSSPRPTSRSPSS